MRVRKGKPFFLPAVVGSLILLVGGMTGLAAETSLVILPADFTLTGANAQHRLLVQKVEDGEFTGHDPVDNAKDGETTPKQ